MYTTSDTPDELYCCGPPGTGRVNTEGDRVCLGNACMAFWGVIYSYPKQGDKGYCGLAPRNFSYDRSPTA